MTQPIPPSQTIFVTPGQSISENLSFVAYSVVIQNNTIWYWYLNDARAYVPPGTTHFISSLPGVNVANITFQSPLELPQPPIPTDGTGGQLVAQFLSNENTPSPGYVGYQPMGRNKLVFTITHTVGLIPLPVFTLPIPASDGVTIFYQPPANLDFGYVSIGYQVAGNPETQQFSIGYIQPSINSPQPIYIPDSLPAGSILLFAATNSSVSAPATFWIVI